MRELFVIVNVAVTVGCLVFAGVTLHQRHSMTAKQPEQRERVSAPPSKHQAQCLPEMYENRICQWRVAT